MEDQQNQPQVETTAEAPANEAATPYQPVAQTDVPQGGAETVETPDAKAPEKAPEGKALPDKQLRQMQATYDRRLAEARDNVARLTMQQQLAAMQDAERQAVAKDTEDVQNGMISQTDADRRQHIRMEVVREQVRLGQIQRQSAEMEDRANLSAKVIMARDVGTEYGLEEKEITALILDKSIQNPNMMMGAVTKLMATKLKAQQRAAQIKPETFDRGPGEGGGGMDVSRMSPEEKVRWALIHQK